MTQDDIRASIRLVPLLDTVEGIENAEKSSEKLLDLCIEKSITSYINVPLDHVAVVYRQVRRALRRQLFKSGRTVIQFKRDPVIVGQIKYVALDKENLRGIRDAGAALVNGFLHGGLEIGKNGLLTFDFDYSVIQKDPRHPFAVDAGFFSPEALPEDQVYPIERTIRLGDVLISRRDAHDLRKLLAVNEVQDKWGHETLAPSVFLVYKASQRPYDFKAIRDWLVTSDDKGVFSQPVATTVARILKVDVRANAESDLAAEKISKNEMGKDYADPSLSKRMSLFLLATDCWIHDRKLVEEMQSRVKPGREAFELEMKNPKLSPQRRDELSREMARFEHPMREAIKSRLYMKSGLTKYLSVLGFSSNQIGQLERVITEKVPGGRHSATEKEAASAVKGTNSKHD